MFETNDLKVMLDELQSVINKMAGGVDGLRGSNSELESAKEMLGRAKRIENEQLMISTVANAVSIAACEKRRLMNIYTMNCENSADFRKAKDIEKRADDAVRAWALLTECVCAEYNGYALLGEEQACYECLSKYAIFLFHNKLYDRDAIFWMFSNLPVRESEPLLNEDLIQRVCDYCNCFA